MNIWWLRLECFALFIGGPTLLAFVIEEPGGVLMLLWVAALAAGGYVLYRTHGQPIFSRGEGVLQWAHLRPVLLRFMICAAGIAAYTWVAERHLWLSFPRDWPFNWTVTMLLYPFLSALPQEVIYRSFFFMRYAPLFSSPVAMVLASALTFGYAHLFFHNWIALLFSTIGGGIFAYAYHSHRSLLLVTVEHALYGCFIFTIGLGIYFFQVHALG